MMDRYGLTRRGIRNPKIVAAMERIPREVFVGEKQRSLAYGDFPLSIGYGQTISQPYIVALMTEILDPNPQAVALEIGTGSGFQTAMLAELVARVYSVENIPQLSEQAGQRLSALGYRNVFLRCADGYDGWAEHAPFDRIIVTCAPDHVPPPLIEQLANEGRMVIPVGPVGDVQHLVLVTRKGEHVLQRELTPVAFVPLTGGHEQFRY